MEKLIVKIIALANNGAERLRNPLRWDNLADLFEGIADIFLYLMITIVPALFVWAGILYVTSGGKEQNIKRAKDTIQWSVVGLFVALIAWVVIYLIRGIFS